MPLPSRNEGLVLLGTALLAFNAAIVVPTVPAYCDALGASPRSGGAAVLSARYVACVAACLPAQAFLLARAAAQAQAAEAGTATLSFFSMAFVSGLAAGTGAAPLLHHACPPAAVACCILAAALAAVSSCDRIT